MLLEWAGCRMSGQQDTLFIISKFVLTLLLFKNNRDDQIAGTTGQSRRAEAIQVYLENMPGYQVKYRAHVSGIGWMPWVLDGAVAGTTGQSRFA